MSFIVTRTCVVCLFAILLSGCGSSDHPELQRVQGRVLHFDEPVVDAFVAFYSEDSKRVATGQTDDQGNFYLSTYEDNDGTVVGEHTVTVTKTSAPTDDSQLSMDEAVTAVRRPAKTRQLLPAQYASAESSPLRFTVTEDGPNEFTIELNGE